MGGLIEPRDGVVAEGNTAVHDGEPELFVLDSHLVVVGCDEKHVDDERYGAGGLGGGHGADSHVMKTDLLEVELGFSWFNGEDNDEDDGDDEEGEEGE